MATTTVNSTSGLLAALKVAHGGDTIELAPGTYSGVTITNAHFYTPVTITSADPTHEAVLSGLGVGSSYGLTFAGLGLTSVGVSDPHYAFRVANSQYISFKSIYAHGDTSLQPTNNLNGFYILNSNHVDFMASSFNDFDNAISAVNSNYMNLQHNVFTEMDKGGVMLEGASDVTIANNKFTNFLVGSTTHSDAVQLTTLNTTSSAHDIVISDNIMSRGTGLPYQGVFIQDETGVTPYRNITVTDNAIVGLQWNGIWVNSGVTGTLDVSHNLVTTWSGVNMDLAASATGVYPSTPYLGSISLRGDFSGAQLTEIGNVAQRYLMNGAAIVPGGNTQVGAISPVTTTAYMWTPVSAPAAADAVLEHGTISGNVLTNATGGPLYLADVGAGSSGQQQVGSAGLTLTGAHGTLTVASNGAFSYHETAQGLVAGQTYVDHFTTTIANTSGQATSSTLDITVTGTTTGDGRVDDIISGATGGVLSGFGAGSTLVGGAGADTFSWSSTSQTGVNIRSFNGNDVIDLSSLGAYHVVNKFDGHAGELIVSHIGVGSWYIIGDATGSGIADFTIRLTGSTNSLGAGNFVL